MTTSADIVNRALELVGSEVAVTGTYPAFDGTVAGNAAGVLYSPVVTLVLRASDPDFARTRMALSIAAPTAIVSPWAYDYLYPAACLRLRQLAPAPGTYDKNDPAPVRGEVAFDTLAGKIIMTNQAGAVAVITTSDAGVGKEGIWDSGFAEAVARRLANPFAMALAGRPDFARELLEEAERYASLAELSEELQ